MRNGEKKKEPSKASLFKKKKPFRVEIPKTWPRKKKPSRSLPRRHLSGRLNTAEWRLLPSFSLPSFVVRSSFFFIFFCQCHSTTFFGGGGEHLYRCRFLLFFLKKKFFFLWWEGASVFFFKTNFCFNGHLLFRAAGERRNLFVFPFFFRRR